MFMLFNLLAQTLPNLGTCLITHAYSTLKEFCFVLFLLYFPLAISFDILIFFLGVEGALPGKGWFT